MRWQSSASPKKGIDVDIEALLHTEDVGSRLGYGRQLGSLLDRPGAARRVMRPDASSIT
jgi:hypothetical protein